jgi:hypothetical protein
MAEDKKKVSGTRQAEITIIEEKLSLTHGILPIEIAGYLSNRFDDILEKIKESRSKLIYTDQIKSIVDRKKAIAKIKAEIAEGKRKRQELIGKWHKKVINYIEIEYGKPIINPNGVTIGYGDRLEVKKNKHLKKYY